MAVITLPSGTTHDTWGTDPTDFISNVPRIRQAVGDSDFEFEVKFESDLLQGYQMQGVLVEQDENDMMRLEFLNDGSSFRIFAASFTDGVSNVKYYVSIANGNPLYMRVRRVGDLWTQSYSYDGVNWTDMNSFVHAMMVTSISPYAGNATAANTVAIDYIFNTIR